MNLIKSRWIAAFLLILLILLHAGTALAATGTVNTSALVLREEPSTDGKALQTLRDGDKFDIIYEDDGWYKVKYGKYTGYVMAKYVKASGTVDEKDDDITLRIGSKGEAVKDVQRRLKELGYYKSSIDGSYGSVTASAVKAFQQKNSLTADGVCGEDTLKMLNSSSAKGANDSDKDDEDDDGTLRIGSKGEAVKDVQRRLKELGYYKSSIDGSYGSVTASAVKAFQQKNGLTADSVCDEGALKKLNSSSAKGANDKTAEESLKTNQMLSPGDDNAQVKAMQIRLKELGYYTNTIDGEYGNSTKSAVKAFQKNNGLTQTGIADEATLEKMVSSSALGKNDIPAGTYVTERLDWFKDGMGTFPRNATIQIKDCKTGLIFKAKVLYGTNHLDAEPLTAADTEILLDINGGVGFSYRRRSVLVQYNGHVYAASIYSEPHGDQTITDNNFDGQFCLHFYGSKIHGSDRVDEDHKECEAQALKYTW